jgi:deferrochelatase/peroxidase EfeB
MEEPERRQSRPTGLTRRNVLAIGGSVFGLAAAGSAGYAFGHTDETPAPTPPAADIVPFDSEHQAGIATPAQARLVFGAFDVVADRREDLRDLLRTWTDAARLMTAGQPAGPVAGNPVVPPQDTGEAEGLPPARLTVTIGLGPTLFGRDGHDRFGLAERRPAALVPLGTLSGDQLQPRAATATSAYRPAPTTRRSRSTPSATSYGSAAARSSCAGCSSASASTRPRRRTRRRPAT